MPNDPMGMGDAMPASGGGMGASPPPAAPSSGEQGPNTIFLSKEALGGKTVKEGDTLSLTIKSVDPETGDAEAAIESGGGEMEGAGEGGYEQAFDKAMPPEPGEGAQ